ncbi:MAG TPA: DUF6259 domain-containing protein [Bryobacteraceae bacterium]|nr:DUF6259 domain-containing protein [Bryobacteraceae bacterium]
MRGTARKTLILLALILPLTASPLAADGGAYFRTSAQTIAVGNSQIELLFNSANGSLLNLVDKTTGLDLISKKVSNYNGLTFTYTTPSNTTTNYAGGYLARSVSLSGANVATGVQLTIQFDQFSADGVALNLSATLVVTVDNSSPLTSWQVSIANHGQVAIQTVSLPSISGIGQLSNNFVNDYLAVPCFSGMLFQDPAHNFLLNRGWGAQLYYPSGFTNMQFLAYYSRESGTGLYMASQDNAGYLKYMNVGRPGADWMTIDFEYVPPLQSGADVPVPYAVTVGVFHGDWYDAASVYRAWALQQKWAQGGPLMTRADVPNWYKSAGMMGWKDTFTTGGPGNAYVSVSQAAAAWQKQLQATPIIDWVAWENLGPWFNIPDFLPPSQGWPAFDSAVSATHAAGGRLMVEPSTSYATVGAPSWGNLQATASRQADGSMYLQQLSVFNQSIQPVIQTDAEMDPTQPWHDALLSFTSQLQQHGMDVIHMDGNPRALPCYATNHSHPPGGGNWWFQDYAQIYRDIRAAGRALNPDFAMGGEFYAEPYLGLTDSGQDETNTGLDPSAIGAGSVVDSTKVSYIPLWQAVYHDYTLTYSMISFLNGQDIPYHRRGLALSLVWGEIPLTEVDDGAPYQISSFNSTLVQYVQRIVTLRTTYGYPFVVLGRMLRPPQPTVPAYTIPPATQIPYTGVNTSAFTAPSILSGAWQSPQGDAALLFTNISDTAVPLSWTIKPADVPLDHSKLYDLYVLNNGSCVSEQPAVLLPYDLSFTTNPTDVVAVILAQSRAGETPQFTGCKLLGSVPATPPNITAVFNAAGYQQGVSSGSFISIQGSNLSPVAYDDWSNSITGGQLPKQIDGVSVSVGGQPAYIFQMTPGQINALAPEVTSGANLTVTVSTPAGASPPFSATGQTYAPAFWPWPGNQPVATHGDYTVAAKNGTFPGTETVPARPGEVITLWGTGFGPTSPPTAAGQLPGSNAGAPTAKPVTITWDGAGIPVLGAVLSSYPGDYQIAIQIPVAAANGDHSLVATVNDISSPTVTLTVEEAP